MELTSNKQKGFIIINIKGRVDTTNYHEFESQIAEIIEKADNKIIFNCAELNYISSSGLRIFLINQKKFMASKGKLHLCSMQPGIKEIFDISGFSSIFKIFSTENEAIDA